MATQTVGEKDPLDVLETWIPIDSHVTTKARQLQPHESMPFAHTARDGTIRRTTLTYEQVRFVLAKLVLKGWRG